MNVLAGTLKTSWGETSKPVSHIKGSEFEQYLRNNLFPPESYDLLFKPSNGGDGRADYDISLKPLDYKYVSKNQGIEFFIDTKFRD